MKKRIQNWIDQYRHMDWAVLYLRMFAGGMMLVHNIGKIQNYNEIITGYPSLPYIDNATSFMLISVAEVLLAVMLIMGLWVRTAALLLSLGMVVILAWPGMEASQLQFVWLGVYIFLIISGGGLYAFEQAMSSTSKAEK